MLRLNKKTEYALLAVEHMNQRGMQGEKACSVREIAGSYRIPYPLLSKVMQQLANHGMVKAVHGNKGGYVLAKAAEHISVADVVEIFDGSVAVAECFKDEKITCPQWDDCSIKDPLFELNRKLYQLLSQTTVHDLLNPHKGGKELPSYGG